MKNSDSDNMSNSNIKDHSEILQLIDEIIAYEQDFTNFSTVTIQETQDVKQDLIEIEHQEINSEDEVLENKEKNTFIKKIKKEPKPKVPTNFKIGFDENGKLVNLDLKKIQPKNKAKEPKGKFNLKKIIPFRKKQDKSDDSESSSKKSKLKGLKGGLGKLGKLKKVIPNKNKSSNEETKK